MKFAEKFDSVDENVNLLPDSVEATEPEMPKPENGRKVSGVTPLEIVLNQSILMTI